jgi:hypothetical protein
LKRAITSKTDDRLALLHGCFFPVKRDGSRTRRRAGEVQTFISELAAVRIMPPHHLKVL